MEGINFIINSKSFKYFPSITNGYNILIAVVVTKPCSAYFKDLLNKMKQQLFTEPKNLMLSKYYGISRSLNFVGSLVNKIQRILDLRIFQIG